MSNRSRSPAELLLGRILDAGMQMQFLGESREARSRLYDLARRLSVDHLADVSEKRGPRIALEDYAHEFSEMCASIAGYQSEGVRSLPRGAGAQAVRAIGLNAPVVDRLMSRQRELRKKLAHFSVSRNESTSRVAGGGDRGTAGGPSLANAMRTELREVQLQMYGAMFFGADVIDAAIQSTMT